MANIQKVENTGMSLSEKTDRDKRYVKLIEFVIDKMRIATNQPAFSKELLDATVLEWKDHLVRHRIKGEDLMSLYSDAIAYRAKTDRRNAFCIEDILSAWFRMQDKRANTVKVAKSQKECKKCDNDGYIYIKRPDNKIVQITCNHE